MPDEQQSTFQKNQVATALAGPPLTLLAVAALQAFNVPITNEQVAVVAPLLQSLTHWIIHRFNKSGN